MNVYDHRRIDVDDRTRTCRDDVNVYVHYGVDDGFDYDVHDCDESDDAICSNVSRNHRILGIYMSNRQLMMPTVAHWRIALVSWLVDRHRPNPSSFRVIADCAEMCPFDLIDDSMHSNCCCKMVDLLDTFSHSNRLV
jgi:hypothetical protein